MLSNSYRTVQSTIWNIISELRFPHLKVRKIFTQKIFTRKIYFILYSVPCDDYYLTRVKINNIQDPIVQKNLTTI